MTLENLSLSQKVATQCLNPHWGAKRSERAAGTGVGAVEEQRQDAEGSGAHEDAQEEEVDLARLAAGRGGHHADVRRARLILEARGHEVLRRQRQVVRTGQERQGEEEAAVALHGGCEACGEGGGGQTESHSGAL